MENTVKTVRVVRVILANERCSGQGRSDGGYIGIYTPQISLP